MLVPQVVLSRGRSGTALLSSVIKHFVVCNVPLGEKSELDVAKCMKYGHEEWKNELLDKVTVRHPPHA
jgi:hypothetical protein